MQYIISRLKEPSSWAAIAAVIAGFGLQLDGELLQHISALGVAAAGLAGFLLQEKKKP